MRNNRFVSIVSFKCNFSSCETAYTTLSPAKIETMVDNKERGAKLIKKHHLFFNRTLSTILIGNNLVNILASVLFSYMLSSTALSGGMQVIISTCVMTPVIVLFSEVIPKLVAKAHPVGVVKTFY